MFSPASWWVTNHPTLLRMFQHWNPIWLHVDLPNFYPVLTVGPCSNGKASVFFVTLKSLITLCTSDYWTPLHCSALPFLLGVLFDRWQSISYLSLPAWKVLETDLYTRYIHRKWKVWVPGLKHRNASIIPWFSPRKKTRKQGGDRHC